MFFKRLNTRLPFDPGIPLRGIDSREMKTCLYESLHILVQSGIIYNSCVHQLTNSANVETLGTWEYAVGLSTQIAAKCGTCTQRDIIQP